jgi:YidC/Oxa1 family membrane protein insertase
MLDQAAKKGREHGFLSADMAKQFGESKLFGEIKVSGTFMNAENAGVMVLAAFLVVGMTATTFLTQRQLMSKNMPADALSGPYAQQQKLLLYVLPVVFAVGGIAFPIGVLVYWTVSNLWTMCQQFYVIRNNPAPGTPAFKAKEERDRAKGKVPATQAVEQTVVVEEPKAPRQQPQRQTKAQRSNAQRNAQKKKR